jgi:xanthine dehydrogenase YagR molybdenum-binding subunit
MKPVPPIEDAYLEYAERSKPQGTQTAPSATTGSAAPAPQPKPGEFKYIGKYTPRVDGRKIVTGAARYTHDLAFEGMLYAKILRSPHASADLVSIDLTDALALPGVKAGLKLKEGRIKWVGEPIAAVAAVSERRAEEALALIKVEYKVLPHVVAPDKAMEPGAPLVQDAGNVIKSNDYARGDAEKGFKEADVVLERTYKTSWEVHQPAETHGSVAMWDGDDLTVWDSTQAVQSVRDGLARALAIPAGRVKVLKEYMGGGFGSKLGLGDYTVTAARLAKETGRPVKLTLTRRENSYCVGYRPSAWMTVKVGARKDGTLTALTLKSYNCGGVGRGDRVAEPYSDMYKCPNVKIEEYAVYVNACGSRATRAPGHTQAMLGLEGMMEELAAKLGMDPLELRLKNFAAKDKGDTGIPYSTKGLEQCYRLGAEKIGWNRRNGKPGSGTGKVRTGIGMASQIWPGAGVPGTLADVKLYPDGSVEVECGTQDIGTGTRTHMAVVAAETLGLEPRDIVVHLGDSDLPWAPISGGSLTVPSVAPAVRDAALKAAEHLKGIASKKLGLPASDLVLEAKKVVSKTDPTKAIELKELARSLPRPLPFHGERGDYPATFAFQTFGVQFAEVEVDTETGKIKVKKVVAAHDIGRVINRQTAESQVLGGVTQGMSAALFEEKVMDPQTGAMVNPNYHDYKVATAMDIPEIVPLFADIVDDRLNNLGTKGLGEPPRIPASAVIANAVYNALGVHVREIPMTPARVLAALKRKEDRP